jgi:hypothetical protein
MVGQWLNILRFAMAHPMQPPAFDLAAERASEPRGRAAVLLGLLIVWQLVFIVAANLLDFFPHRVHRLDELTSYRELQAGTKNPCPTAHALANITDGWAQLTGQYQQWWLFAPDFPPQSTFPLVELRWDDSALGLAPVQLRSSLEPQSTASYFHPPTSADRLLHYECNLGLGYVYWSERDAAVDAANWRQLLLDMVQSQWKSMRAYMRWRTAEYLAAHPDLPPPDEVRLLIRIYPTPAAGELPGRRSLPIDRPYARWRCAENGPPEMLPVQAYESSSGQFVSLPFPPGQQPAIKIARASK